MWPNSSPQTTNRSENKDSGLKSGIVQGLLKGWKAFIWLLKIIIPISFITALLVHFGIIYKLDFILTPIMNWLCLPASAAVAIIAGLFTGIYGTVAALSVMPFSMDHMILIAVFTLISHNLIQESLVQANSGLNFFYAAFFRLFMSVVVTFVCAKIMHTTAETGGVAAAGSAFAGNYADSFSAMLASWGWKTFKLVVQICCIIMPLMVILELAKKFHIIDFITKITYPVLAAMGLSRSTGMLWLTATVFGLTFGAAVIVEEARSNEFKKDDLKKLHLSIGVNHSMIEDPALFLPLGLPMFWLWIPRLVAAILIAWLYSVFVSAGRFYVKRTGHKKLCNH